MAKQRTRITSAELAVLEHLWDHGPAVVRDIAQGVYSQNTPSYHATVNSLLEKLEEKQLVTRDRGGFAHVFAARLDRAAFVGAELQRIADSHFDGSLAPMLLSLVERVQLSRRDREAIKRIIRSIE